MMNEIAWEKRWEVMWNILNLQSEGKVKVMQTRTGILITCPNKTYFVVANIFDHTTDKEVYLTFYEL